VLSVLFIQWWGVDGLIAANTLSMLVIPLWTQPILVYRRILRRPPWRYYARYALYAALTALCAGGTWWLASCIHLSHPLLELGVKAVLCLILPNTVTLVVFARSAELRDLWAMGKGMLRKNNA